VEGLNRFHNVHLLGQEPHERLGQFLRNFDVCVVPYIKSPATTTVVPTKVNEYLAAGKPVVSTELLTMCDFNEQHGVLMTAPSQPDYFLKAIEESLLLPTDPETVGRRTKVAKLNDWQIQLASMSSLIMAATLAKNPE
jgi:glycosyltransferase involved in cell wall biosynthesis